MGTFTQDMPPPDGYATLRVDRFPTRVIMTGKRALVLTAITTVIGHYLYVKYEYKRELKHRFEVTSSMKAIVPLLIAEQDRRRLKHYKRNIEEEKEVMRYYPAWKVGTWFGEPIYKTIAEDELIRPHCYEDLMHSSTRYVNELIMDQQISH